MNTENETRIAYEPPLVEVKEIRRRKVCCSSPKGKGGKPQEYEEEEWDWD